MGGESEIAGAEAAVIYSEVEEKDEGVDRDESDKKIKCSDQRRAMNLWLYQTGSRMVEGEPER